MVVIAEEIFALMDLVVVELEVVNELVVQVENGIDLVVEFAVATEVKSLVVRFEN